MQDSPRAPPVPSASTLQTAQADSDESNRYGDVEGMISAGVDGIVIGVVSDKVGETVLKDAEAANIPVTFMQRSPGVTRITTRARSMSAMSARTTSAAGRRVAIHCTTRALGNGSR